MLVVEGKIINKEYESNKKILLKENSRVYKKILKLIKEKYGYIYYEKLLIVRQYKGKYEAFKLYNNNVVENETYVIYTANAPLY